jgi:hypothetical protein
VYGPLDVEEEVNMLQPVRRAKPITVAMDKARRK